MPTSDNDIRAYDNALKRIKHFRGRELTRRQVLKASAATALGATLASQFVPREVHADSGRDHRPLRLVRKAAREFLAGGEAALRQGVPERDA